MVVWSNGHPGDVWGEGAQGPPDRWGWHGDLIGPRGQRTLPAVLRAGRPGQAPYLDSFVSSSSKEPMSKTSAAFTSSWGDQWGGTAVEQGLGISTGEELPSTLPGPGSLGCYLLQRHLPVQGTEEGALLYLWAL